MLSTLCSYESLFGPYHPQTLHLMAEVALALWHHRELAYAHPLLERAVRDLGRYLGRDHEARLSALATLRDLLFEQGDYERAGTTQRELWECQKQRLGLDHPETLAAREGLVRILLTTGVARREI
jgi:hypothetical protein